MLSVVAALCLLVCAYAAEDIHVLATKELANKVAVQGRDAVIKYAIYNTGDTCVCLHHQPCSALQGGARRDADG